MKKILMTLTLALAAAITIPASAQSTTTSEKTAQCCKDKEACDKDGKACATEGQKTCAKEGAACCKKGDKEPNKVKHGKKGSHKVKHGKKMKGDRYYSGAQKNKTVMRHSDRENPMFKGITLSEEQKGKVKELREKSKAAERKSKAEAKAKSMEEMKKLRADFDKEIEKILDKDQLKQYQANKAELEAKRADKQSKLPKLEKKDK